MNKPIDFRVKPYDYHHWNLKLEDKVAWLGLTVKEDKGIRSGYELKLNSYDLGVDIELHDIVSRLPLEHPEISVVVIHSLAEKVFCAGANIKMLGLSDHEHKVNFCKFTNETRIEIENANHKSNLKYLCVIEGACAGGGYELALACDEIIMVDDGSSSVSLPELPLLGVLPGTGGLTRLVDKRRVRRDRADFFCTTEEGLLAPKALKWGLVDHIAPPSQFKKLISDRIEKWTDKEKRAKNGLKIEPLQREINSNEIIYKYLSVKVNRQDRYAELRLYGPDRDCPSNIEEIFSLGSKFWPLQIIREVEDAILHLRLNEPQICTWLFKSEGDLEQSTNYSLALYEHRNVWWIREINSTIERTLKRVDVSARSLIAAVEPESCFSGFLLEFVLAADQALMLLDGFEDEPDLEAEVTPTELNFGHYKMANGLSRLQTRFFDTPDSVKEVSKMKNKAVKAESCEMLGLVTFIPDDIDWEEEIRLIIESRASYSGDALTGLEANLRFPGPETMETKIFARLSAWQNWIFQRPNAVGEDGALTLYGSGKLPNFRRERT